MSLTIVSANPFHMTVRYSNGSLASFSRKAPEPPPAPAARPIKRTGTMVRRPVHKCGCAAWRPATAKGYWHLATCGIAPAPTTLRLV